MIRVYQNFYFDRNPDRQKEIEECFYRNSVLSGIHFVPIYSEQRIKFFDFFSLINATTSVDDINILANSDIYFDNSIQLSEKITSAQCYALTRWDVQPNGQSTHFARADSQDVWIFRGFIRNVYSDYYLGFRGCDNRLAFELQKAGYQVSNPSLSIKTHHLHLSEVRNYTLDSQFLVPKPYAEVPFHEMKA